MTNPKINVLYFDIETTPAIVATFQVGKGKQTISHKQILKRSQVMCISWAWNNDKVQHAKFNLDTYDWYKKDDNSDYKLIKDFLKVVEKADLIVGHNAREFDVAYLRHRIVKYQLPDFTPTLIDDTYKATQKDIRFTSHKLDDLGDYLGYGNKAEHGDGIEWWVDILRGDEKIFNKMVHYCDVDVIRLREIYKHLAPYIKSSLNAAVFFERPNACPNPLCGQSERPMIIRGYRYTKTGKFPKLQCPVCNKYVDTGKNRINKKDTGFATTDYNR